MYGVAKGAIALGALALIGCGTGSETSTSPRLTLTSPSFSKDDAGSAAGDHVTGSATIILPGFDNALERYSIDAERHADGLVSGEFEEFSAQTGGQRIHAHVVCFTVTGNSARLAAQLDQSNVPFGPVGSYVIWSVIDNGEGKKAAPDQTTDIFFGGTAAQAQFHCQTGFNLAPYFSSLRGNLQVR
jgi:hypothetical protein